MRNRHRGAAITLALIMIFTQSLAVFAGSTPEPGLGNADSENEIRSTVRGKLSKDMEPEGDKELSTKRSISMSEERITEKKQILQKGSDLKTDEMPDIVPGQIIVKYKSGTSIKMKSTLNSKVSAVSSKPLNRLGITQLELPRDANVHDAVDELKDDPNVDYVEPVYVRKAFGMAKYKSSSVVESVYCSEPFYTKGWQWGLEAVSLEDMWADVTEEERSEITIAIVDTGVDVDHEEFEGNIVPGYDFTNNDLYADDDCGHGTHVAGIAAAAQDSKGMAGVAGGAKIMPVKVLDEDGYGSTVTVVNGILYAVNNGADIINLSLGSDDPSRAEEEAVKYALDRGVTVVAAAGNERGNEVCYPAAYDGVIAVGAADWTGGEFVVAYFSSVVPELDLLAPGVDILSTIPEELDNPGNRRWTGMGDVKQDGYTVESGTSMAAPFVAGMAALLLAENHDLDYSEVLTELLDNSLDFYIEYEDQDINVPILNGGSGINPPFSFPRAKLDSFFESPGMRRFNLSITDYKDTVADAVYGEFELMMGEYDYQNGFRWIVEPYAAEDIDVVDGEGTVLVETEMNKDFIFYVEAKDGYMESDSFMVTWDENEDFDEAVELEIDVETTGSIGSVRDEDYYEFFVSIPGYYVIESTGETDTYGCLFDEDEWDIVWDDDSGTDMNFRIQFDDDDDRLYLDPGWYYVVVGGYEPGDYGIIVRGPKNIFGTISLPEGVSAEEDIYINICLYAGEMDPDEGEFEYEFVEHKGVEILSGSNSVDYQIPAYEVYDQVVGYYILEDNRDYSFDYAYSGYYSELGTVPLYDDASLVAGEADNIDMTLIPTSTLDDEERNTIEEAASLQLGVGINGIMHYDGDYDLYKLSVAEEGNYLIRVEEYPGSEGSMERGYLYDSSGDVVNGINNRYYSNEDVSSWSTTYNLTQGIYYYKAYGSGKPFNSFGYKVTAEEALVISGLLSLPGGNLPPDFMDVLVITEDLQGNEYTYPIMSNEEKNSFDYAIGVPLSGRYTVSYYIDSYNDDFRIYAREGYYSSTGTKLDWASAAEVNESSDSSNINLELIALSDTAGDSKETAKQIGTGVVIKGNINSVDDKDYYKFTVPQGGGYYDIGIEAQEYIGVYLYDNGMWIFYDEGEESYSGGFLDEGTHYLMVRAEDEDRRERYRIGEYVLIVSGIHRPIATDVSISGTRKVNSTLTGRYTYFDGDNDRESGSTYRWLRSSTAGGAYAAITGATAKTYNLTQNDLGKYIKFEVIPKTTIEPSVGEAAISSAAGPIQAASTGKKSGGGGGGGGGGRSSVPSNNLTYEQTGAGRATISTGADGRTTVEVKVDKSKVEGDLKSIGSKPVILDVKTEAKQDNLKLNIPSSIFSDAAKAQKTVTVDSNDVGFTIEPGTFDMGSLSGEVKLEASQLTTDSIPDIMKSKDAEANELTLVYDFDLSIGGNNITDFDKPVTITIKYDTSKVTDLSKVGVYYYNEKDGRWEYIGGKANADGTITFTVEHFSKYAAMEYKKTFNDIKSHWAKADIELLTAKHIVRSESATSFAPDNNITRASFASMIVKGMDIKGVSTDKVFADIPADSWYKEDVYKAYAAGIIEGVSDKYFAPNELITREQMATMLMRAYEYSSGEKLGEIVTTMNVRFTDESSISSWARRNVILANAKGLISGNPDGTYNPKGNTTKAQASTVIRRLMQKLNKL